MNAKELRLAAEHFKNRSYEESNEGYDEFCKDRVAILSHGVDHILATVHADDDEPVTVEWLREIGWYVGVLHEHDFASIKMPIGKYLWFYSNSESLFADMVTLIVTPIRGQFRHLLAGLGMEKKA